MNLRGQDRTEFPKRVKIAAFKRACNENGIPHCQSCGCPLTAGNIIYEHILADGLSGEPTLENCKVHCKTCATKKTVEDDNPIMQKADRQLKANYGIVERQSRPMPGTKASGIKMKFGGGWEYRR